VLDPPPFPGRRLGVVVLDEGGEMGLSLAIARLNVELFNRGFFNNVGSVLDFGAQDLHMDLDDLEGLANASSLQHFRRADFAPLADYPAQRMGTENFYKLFGIERYQCMDIGGGTNGTGANEAPEGMRWNAFQIDLNTPLPGPVPEQRFDLVTDYGNNEHAFHVTEAYRTMHRMCAPGGLMVIFQELMGTNGYYNFNPSFYEAMAHANDYERIFTAEVQGMSFFRPTAVPAVPEDGSHLGLAYVVRKLSDDDFKLPDPGAARSLSKAAPDAFEIMRLSTPDNPSYLSAGSVSGIDMIGGRNALKILLGRG